MIAMGTLLVLVIWMVFVFSQRNPDRRLEASEFSVVGQIYLTTDRRRSRRAGARGGCPSAILLSPASAGSITESSAFSEYTT